MKKVLIFASALLLSACASVGPKTACRSGNLQVPSYFAHGETLAAFKVSGAAYGRSVDGLLQIKKTGEEKYEASLFTLLGGIKVAQATVTPQKTGFTFILKQADYAAARAKAERLFSLLLFPPKGAVSCREKDGTVRVRVEPSGVYYEYAAGHDEPEAAVLPKTLGDVRLSYGEYAPYETDSLPHELVYKDGVLEAELVLLTLKK